jgi:hypothetical protein
MTAKHKLIILATFILLLGSFLFIRMTGEARTTNTLGVTKASDWEYVTKTATLTASFTKTAQSTKVQLEKDGQVILFTQPMQSPTLEQKDSKYIFTDTVTQTQFVYHITDDGLKEDIILNQVSVTGVFPLQIKTNGLQMNFNQDNVPVFTNQAGEYQFNLEAPWAKDAAGVADHNLVYRLESSTGDTFDLNLNLDQSWLNDPRRVYPITIDPTVFFRGINLRGLRVNIIPPTTCTTLSSCGNTFTCTHTKYNGVAPVQKVVTYGTVSSSIGGTGAKCWITQNLGAANQASAATDNTEASAGWYWQFNRKQGYQYTTVRTPLSTWITSINENLSWQTANDPCTLELGAGWRLPTYTEWLNADGAPQNWANYNDTFASVLKLHAAGYLGYSSGGIVGRGASGLYWSSTQTNTPNGWHLYFASSTSYLNYGNKAYGFSVCCLRD